MSDAAPTYRYSYPPDAEPGRWSGGRNDMPDAEPARESFVGCCEYCGRNGERLPDDAHWADADHRCCVDCAKRREKEPSANPRHLQWRAESQAERYTKDAADYAKRAEAERKRVRESRALDRKLAKKFARNWSWANDAESAGYRARLRAKYHAGEIEL